jgi:hypothetical protein
LLKSKLIKKVPKTLEKEIDENIDRADYLMKLSQRRDIHKCREKKEYLRLLRLWKKAKGKVNP